MDIVPWLLPVIMLLVLLRTGLVRPTGFVGRSPAEREQDRRRDAAAKWLEKDSEQNPP